VLFLALPFLGVEVIRLKGKRSSLGSSRVGKKLRAYRVSTTGWPKTVIAWHNNQLNHITAFTQIFVKAQLQMSW
jgi:hypothetical protein